MPFSLRPDRRFPEPFLKLPLVYFLSFASLITLLALSSGPADAEWMSLGASDSGTTVYADPATIRRERDLVKMLVLFDFKTKQTKADVSYLSAKAQMEYDCAEQRFEGHAVLYFSGNMGNDNLLDRSSGKASGYELHQVVLTTICGKLRAARSDAQQQSTMDVETVTP